MRQKKDKEAVDLDGVQLVPLDHWDDEIEPCFTDTWTRLGEYITRHARSPHMSNDGGDYYGGWVIFKHPIENKYKAVYNRMLLSDFESQGWEEVIDLE